MDPRLLEWATRNAGGASEEQLQEARQRMAGLDPEIVQMILGRDEAVVMRNVAGRIGASRVSSEDEAAALEELEQMVENIDSAINVGKMNLWPAIFDAYALGDNRTAALSLIGTAAQNNPHVQADLVARHVLDKLCESLQSDAEATVLKAIYAASAVVRNDAAICAAFCKQGGLVHLDSARSRFPGRAAPRVDYLLEVLQTQFPDLKCLSGLQ